PILIDQFLDAAVEVDVDCICDGQRAIIGGVMQHIEEAGVHSGDSACVIPPYSLPPDIVEDIKHQTRAMALELNVRGLMNVQFAVTGLVSGRVVSGELSKDATPHPLPLTPHPSPAIYILEVNPRAS